jgi:hypothetical protein
VTPKNIVGTDDVNLPALTDEVLFDENSRDGHVDVDPDVNVKGVVDVQTDGEKTKDVRVENESPNSSAINMIDGNDPTSIGM